MKHEVEISIGDGVGKDGKPNGTYALAVFVGPFGSKKEAQEYATRIKELLEREAGGRFTAMQ